MLLVSDEQDENKLNCDMSSLDFGLRAQALYDYQAGKYFSYKIDFFLVF